MNVAVYGRTGTTAQEAFAKNVIEILAANGCNIFLHKKYYEFLKKNLSDKIKFSFFENHEDIKNSVDYLFSVGGDGTLLDTILLVKDSGIPIVGVNAGRLGFLSGISKENLTDDIKNIIKGNCTTEERTLLRLESNHPLFEGINIALNDFALYKKESSSMITIHAYLNGEFLNSYWADGIIIATPTGSTGYSLSCGGPIVVPQSESFVITPIAPHNLNVRPIIVSDKNVITLEVEGRGQITAANQSAAGQFMVSLDSRSASIDATYQIAIRKESYSIKLVKLKNENFLNTLQKNSIGDSIAGIKLITLVVRIFR